MNTHTKEYMKITHLTVSLEAAILVGIIIIQLFKIDEWISLSQ